MNTIAIYAIICEPTAECYVGATTNFEKRKSDHISRLRAKKHSNTFLQEAWNCCEENSFKYAILEHCDAEKAAMQEQYWIDKMPNTYNITGRLETWTTIKDSKPITKKEYVYEGPVCRRLGNPFKNSFGLTLKPFSSNAFKTKLSALPPVANPPVIKLPSSLTFADVPNGNGSFKTVTLPTWSFALGGSLAYFEKILGSSKQFQAQMALFNNMPKGAL
jgi:predicted GIY-YIG superfamily endonuclease